MPRAPRIEFEGAVYHVMARGNRRANIVDDEGDRKLFCRTLDEVCRQTGWHVYAWVLMSNHYHLVFKTPQANLVSGMTWFQNTFTRRINTKNQLWGRLFGDRYKAVLVEADERVDTTSRKRPADYLATLIDYVHLNPARAGIIAPAKRPDDSLLDYPWSSYTQAYAVPPSKRKPWMDVETGLGGIGQRDTATGRRAYHDRLEKWMRIEEAERCGQPEIDGQSLQSTLRRGWYWGSQEFKEKLIARFGERWAKGKEQTSQRNRTAQGDEQLRDFYFSKAERILAAGTRELGLTEGDFLRPVRGDLRRSAIGWAIWQHTSGVPHQWIADRLKFKSAANSSQQVRKFNQLKPREIPKPIRAWQKELKNVD